MNGDVLFALGRLLLAAVGLVLVGRLLRTARIYLSWWALLLYAVAWLALVLLLVLQARLSFLPDLSGPRLVVEGVLGLSLAGCLLEHVRADRRRAGDARRLLEQWRQASGQARQRAAELEVLATITAGLVGSLNLRQVLQAVVDQALRLVSADAVVVYLSDGETGGLRPQGVSASAGPAAELPAPRAQGLTVAVGRTGAPVFVEDTARHPAYPAGGQAWPGAIASLPLSASGKVVGVLNVIYRQPQVLNDDDRRMLLALAGVSAVAIHNAAQYERLARLAVTDDLTGLPNRRRFVETLRAEAQRARRYQRALSLLMLDLDGLKQVNDRHGHAAGDAVLRGVAQVLRSHLRDTDLPARLSGDEFAVVLPETEAEAAETIAERIRAGVEAVRVPVEGGTAGATVSLGLVSAEGQALPEVPRFLRLADEALYRAKAAGRNTLVVSAGAVGRDGSRLAPEHSAAPP